jgi:hypothetical protein
MGDRDVDDIKNSAHDIRNYARQINAALDGKILTALKDASTKGTSEQLDAINETIRAGFASVVEAIANIQPPTPPGPKLKGTIMADYSIPDDTPDGRVTFNLAATDAEGQPITDPAVLASLVFEAASSNEDAFSVTLDGEQPDPMKREGGYHVGAPGQAAVTSNLKDADGNLIGTGTDGFTVTTGKVALGSVTAELSGLTPIV